MVAGGAKCVLCEQTVMTVECREVIVSVVLEGALKFVRVHELMGSREHWVGPIEAKARLEDLKFRFNASGEVVLGEKKEPLVVAKAFENMISRDFEAELRAVSGERRVFARSVTWNLQAQSPALTANELRAKLLPLNMYHVIQVGTQECERSIAASVVNQSKVKWTALLRETVGDDYEAVASHTLQASHSIVFVHRSLLALVSDARSAAVATGVGKDGLRLGNKGGIGIALTIGGTHILFVAAHLTAHQKNAETRNKQVHKISHDLRKALGVGFRRRRGENDDGNEKNSFFHGEDKSAALKKEEDEEEETTLEEKKTGESALLDIFDAVVWSGDLNYRVELSRPEADALLLKKDFIGLKEADQLTAMRTARRVFVGYDEGPLSFPPTYKFDATHPLQDADALSDTEVNATEDSDVYDSSAKQRIPSWTDRHLWGGRAILELLDYCSVPDLRVSDHRPVACAWKLHLQSTEENLLSSSANFSSREGEEGGHHHHHHHRNNKNLHQSEVCLVQ